MMWMVFLLVTQMHGYVTSTNKLCVFFVYFPVVKFKFLNK